MRIAVKAIVQRSNNHAQTTIHPLFEHGYAYLGPRGFNHKQNALEKGRRIFF